MASRQVSVFFLTTRGAAVEAVVAGLDVESDATGMSAAAAVVPGIMATAALPAPAGEVLGSLVLPALPLPLLPSRARPDIPGLGVPGP